jgi:hypothetical protein
VKLPETLTNTEESVLLDRIIDLIERGFPPRLEDIQDMANRLFGVRDVTRVGSRWAGNFVRRQPALNMRFRRRIDYQRALAEDPKIIQAWFALVQNTIAKYGIVNSDIYNFDETRFLMGMLSHATSHLWEKHQICPESRRDITPFIRSLDIPNPIDIRCRPDDSLSHPHLEAYHG